MPVPVEARLPDRVRHIVAVSLFRIQQTWPQFVSTIQLGPHDGIAKRIANPELARIALKHKIYNYLPSRDGYAGAFGSQYPQLMGKTWEERPLNMHDTLEEIRAKEDASQPAPTNTPFQFQFGRSRVCAGRQGFTFEDHIDRSGASRRGGSSSVAPVAVGRPSAQQGGRSNPRKRSKPCQDEEYPEVLSFEDVLRDASRHGKILRSDDISTLVKSNPEVEVPMDYIREIDDRNLASEWGVTSDQNTAQIVNDIIEFESTDLHGNLDNKAVGAQRAAEECTEKLLSFQNCANFAHAICQQKLTTATREEEEAKKKYEEAKKIHKDSKQKSESAKLTLRGGKASVGSTLYSISPASSTASLTKSCSAATALREPPRLMTPCTVSSGSSGHCMGLGPASSGTASEVGWTVCGASGAPEGG